MNNFDDRFLNWSLFDALIVAVRRAHQNRIKDPSVLAKTDQDTAYYRDLLSKTNLDPDDFTTRDFYMMMLTISIMWITAIQASEQDKMSDDETAGVFTAVGTTAFGVISSIAPILLKDIDDFNFGFEQEDDNPWNIDWDEDA